MMPHSPCSRSSVDTFLAHSQFCLQARSWHRDLLSSVYHRGGLDRIHVLGSEISGHSGCVNALSWAKGGDVLISSGDDRTIRLWQMDSCMLDHDYPFVCNTIINTGHQANVFNAQMLPHSSRIATVSGDYQVRVFDHEKAPSYVTASGENEYSTNTAVIRVLRCHEGRVKRIVTEHSPDLFLTVAEDGSVRQHDLRVPHSCTTNSCPSPLVQLPIELSTIALSPLTPYQFVVAGVSGYGYLFDRRYSGRRFQEEWGIPLDSGQMTNCVRRFGRMRWGPHERQGWERITGAKMPSSNGHEVVLSYSSDAIYLYSTNDDPRPTSMAIGDSTIVPPNKQTGRERRSSSGSVASQEQELDARMEEDIERIIAESTSSMDHPPSLDPQTESEVDVCDYDDEVDDDEDDAAGDDDAPFGGVPTIMPSARFEGIANVETVKDVNFLGPRDEFIVSGSDDGNWFMWEKETGRLHGIYEGDSSVVNVIEGHPYLPLVAVSGIDYTVKLFAPNPLPGPSTFSRLDQANAIMTRNARAASPRRIPLPRALLYHARRMAEEGHAINPPECAFQ